MRGQYRKGITMKPAICVLTVIVIGAVEGCGPGIKSITPTGKKPLESVIVEGTAANGGLEGLDHAVVCVDGGPVGTPLFSYPKPEVFIPVRRADGRTTGDKVEISATNASGKGNEFKYAAALVPVNAPPVTVDQITPPAHPQFSNEITVTIFGNGIFPGARNTNLHSPHAGPPEVQAVPANGGDHINAVRVIMLTNNTIQAFFPDTMPRGFYRVFIRNDERFGGVSGVSTVMFEWK